MSKKAKQKVIYHYGTLADLLKNYVADRDTPLPANLLTKDTPPITK